jgi:hypothetical protein
MAAFRFILSYPRALTKMAGVQWECDGADVEAGQQGIVLLNGRWGPVRNGDQ